jgi:hypothetical protein
MKCLSCNADVSTQGGQGAKGCPKCGVRAGYKLYAYTQTNAEQDRNHAAELQGQQDRPGERRYYTAGMCFANTLLWMKYAKEEAGGAPFERRYVGDPQAQTNLYQEFLRLMGKQDKYIDTLFGSFEHYANYAVLSGTSKAKMASKGHRPRFRLVCDACGQVTPWKDPAPNTKIGGFCTRCGKPGRREAGAYCSNCPSALVVFEAPGYKQCPTCQMHFAIEPHSAGRTPEGQANQNVAHQKKREVYRKQASKYDLTLLDYKNGFIFNDVRGLVAEMFSGQANRESYLGAFGFEGDNGHAHVTSFWIRGGLLGFFDPNLGEFLFPDRATFQRWLANHLTADHWPGDPVKYAHMHDAWFVALFA